MSSALIFTALIALPAAAQERRPAQRQTLTELAYVLGESHALRQACDGEADQFWRGWMTRLIETESPDEAFNRRLRDSFNTGFAAAQARYPQCDAEARAAAAKSAARGRVLSRGMSGG